MRIPAPIELTQEEVSQDVQKGTKEDYGLTVPEFLDAVESGKLKSDYAVQELLSWINTLPANDPAFIEENGRCLASKK
jgi:hypothetical protein